MRGGAARTTKEHTRAGATLQGRHTIKLGALRSGRYDGGFWSRRVAPPASVDRYVVIGNPVAHSLSPEIHARFAAATGEKLEYGRLLVPREHFARDARAFFAGGGKGANVTLPFKEEALALAQAASDRARLAGAANFLARHGDRVEADNTDGAGLVNDLARLGVALREATILVLGAGGAARGVMAPLLALSPAALHVANRTRERAEALAARFSALGTVIPHALAEIPEADFDVVINATSTSVHGETLALPPRLLRPGVFAYDMAYGPAARAFVARAEAAGARASDGLGMLVEQAAESFALWRGKRPDPTPVLAALRERYA